ncbi:hypothetical protein OH146_08345 [Salinibacterium sp. SYSU T00001]|uniref:hypothetical protein n=1 Tax=Homoserinimonas sedimenticola TaxID=2986805 RepID=UPI0022366AD0|nr:hypothetical protein [Salinibacterium sedimenticola]MCW4385784.1 hypothetical protein [Salinibacterium sedimenticola]
MPPRQNQALDTVGAVTAAYWPVPLSRAVVALAVGIAVTFLAEHSPRVGLLALAGLALGGGAVVALLSRGRIADRTATRIFVAQGLISALIGVIALPLALTGAGLGTLLLLATVWAVLTGALELYAGYRLRTGGGRDWVTAGAGTLALALVLLLAPSDTVTVVGIIGAYAVILGVYLVIAALSLKWAAGDGQAAARASGADPASNTGATR